MPKLKPTSRSRRSKPSEELGVGDKVKFQPRKNASTLTGKVTVVRDFSVDIRSGRKSYSNIDKSRVTLVESARKDAPSEEESEKQTGRVTGPKKVKQSKGSSSSRKAHKSKAEEEEEYDEAALHTPKKTPLKSPTHYRSDKKKKREYFTKEEVMVLVEHVHEKNGEPQWANLKKEHQDSSGLFANRTSVDLKDKYRNLEVSGVAKKVLDRMAAGKDFEDLIDKIIVTPGKRKDFHFRSEKKRKRTPWRDEELACLTAGVTKYGTAWTKIKSINPEKLKDRTTLDLKDKWRNMQRAEKRLHEK